MAKEQQNEPLLRLVKRGEGGKSKLKRTVIVYVSSVLISIVVGCLLVTVLAGKNPFEIFGYIVEGNFGTSRKIWELLKDFALLLGVSLAIVPAFRMKFWNLGGNGQILIGGLTAMACMHYFGKTLDLSVGIIIPLMIIFCMLASALWAVIPAIFKAHFGTNESLFTLMMNYIALQLVKIFINVWDESNSSSLKPSHYEKYGLPMIINQQFLIIATVAIIAVLMIIYLKRTKHGYEISVVGESKNTAKYIGINQKKVIIRTMLLSGAICGIVGMLIVAGKDHTINTTTDSNMGFTAIMTVWLAGCDPIAMLGTCFFVSFISRGMNHASTYSNITDNSIVNLVLGTVYFIIIACKFFIDYKIVIRKKNNNIKSENLIGEGGKSDA